MFKITSNAQLEPKQDSHKHKPSITLLRMINTRLRTNT